VLTLVNQHVLSERAAIMPFIEALTCRILRVAVVSEINEVESGLVQEGGWIVASDTEQRGVGFHLYQSGLGTTALRSRIERVQSACVVAEWLAQRSAVDWQVHEEMRLPQGWRVFRATTEVGALLWGVSFPVVERVALYRHAVVRYPMVRLPIAGWLLLGRPISDGDTISVEELFVEFEGQGLGGELSVSEGGSLWIQPSINEDEMKRVESGVCLRLDLGDVELGLDEVVALRAGSVLELEGGLPLRCFIRVGASALAEGEISVLEKRFSLKIVRMMSN
jgi:hypothetical protein